MATAREWTYNSYSTHAFNYTVCQRAQQFERAQPCTLVAATIDDEINYDIPCFDCDRTFRGPNSSLSGYLKHYSEWFASTLSTRFPSIERCCAEAMGDTLQSIIKEANLNHFRSCRVDVGMPFTVTRRVVIHTHQGVTSDEDADEATVLRESFEEAAGPGTIPASFNSMHDLLADKELRESREGDRYENGWSASDQRCVICLDEIATRRASLNMPCCHVFHENCLLEWLNTSNVCPLCRYEMPIRPTID